MASTAGEREDIPAIRVTGGTPVVVGCDVTSTAGDGIVVRGNGANPTVRDCTVRDNRDYGIYVLEGGNPTVRDCTFADGKQNGIYVHTNGAGTFERCTVTGNADAGIAVTTDEIAARVTALAALPDIKSIADAVLKDVYYSYRYVTITKHPESLTVAPRSGAIFSVEATGMPPLAYQWLLNGAPVPGGTASTLNLTNVDASRAGTYTVVVTSDCGPVTSSGAVVTNKTPTSITTQPLNGSICTGTSVNTRDPK